MVCGCALENQRSSIKESAMKTSPKEMERKALLLDSYGLVRKRTEAICYPLETEDFVVQTIADVSLSKCLLGHTTLFFETVVLVPILDDYNVFDPSFNYVYNSYYDTLGARVIRTGRA